MTLHCVKRKVNNESNLTNSVLQTYTSLKTLYTFKTISFDVRRSGAVPNVNPFKTTCFILTVISFISRLVSYYLTSFSLLTSAARKRDTESRSNLFCDNKDGKKEAQTRNGSHRSSMCWCTFGKMYDLTDAQTDSFRRGGGIRRMAEENPIKQLCLFHNSAAEMTSAEGKRINRWDKSSCSFHFVSSAAVLRCAWSIKSHHILSSILFQSYTQYYINKSCLCTRYSSQSPLYK